MEKDLKKLEYDKILELFASIAVTSVGKEKFFILSPMQDKKEIEKAFEETTKASFLIERLGSAPFCEIADITFEIKALKNRQTLSISSLLHVAQIFSLAKELKAYFENDVIPMKEFEESLKPYFSKLYSNLGILEKIQKSIVDENTIDSKASPKLSAIRKDEQKIENEIKDTLNHFVHTSKYVMEPIVTIRNDRYVVPIKDTYRGEVKGFVHDISASGSTIFIEPIHVFEKNNLLLQKRQEEMLEIEKILQELSSLLMPYTAELTTDLETIADLDFIFAKAKYMLQNQGNCPIVSSKKELYFEKAVHPLLDKVTAVPVTLELGTDFNSLIITGPNTGGKTVLLKTIGLLSLMACSGLPIPASDKSRIFVFDHIFADIGDEQSIQASLSTFSSHMNNIISITKLSTKNSLILLDELGAGTDPVEGSLLAISILEHFHTQNSLTVVTTHYPEIKNYALTHTGFQNASFEFDLNTLSPTYHLLVGIPGKSNAFAICKRLGLAPSILERAQSLSKEENVQMEDLLKKIYDDKVILEEEKEKALQYNQEIQALKQELLSQKKKHTEEQEIQIKQAKRDAIFVLEDAKKEANEIIAELEETSDLKEANQLRKKLNHHISNLSQPEKQQEENTKITAEQFQVGMPVLILALNQTGIIKTMPNRSGEVSVQMGNASMKVNIKNLKILAKQENKKEETKSGVHTNLHTNSVASEINVIGLNVDEAISVIDPYIDHAIVSNFSPIRIVHGKGTGKLRSGIHAYLKTNPVVKSFRLGTFGEGEMGVTVVELKIK